MPRPPWSGWRTLERWTTPATPPRWSWHYGGRGVRRRRVKEELRRRGVPQTLWDAALEELPDSAPGAGRPDSEALPGGISAIPESASALAMRFSRRGFSWGEVKSALSRYGEIEEDI